MRRAHQGWDRRGAVQSALGLAFAAALLPASFSARAATSAPSGAIHPPLRPLVYTRSLRRELSGGAQFLVTRQFSVQFAPNGSGFRVDGEQISAEVEAPDNLARFAELEQQRVEKGIFPLLLDSAGHILSGARNPPAVEVEQALQAVTDGLRESPYDPQDLARINALVERVHQAGGRIVTQLPLDLFAPDEEQRRQHEEIALPWGETGAVTTVFTAERDPATGLMRHAQREVITELPGSRRSTIERWRLGPE